MTEAKIGELQLSKSHHEEATLHCYCSQPAILVIDLLDELGRSYRHEQHQLQAGEHTIPLSLHRIPPGEYNAWINIANQAAIRQVRIPQRRESRMSFLRWLFF